MGRLISWPVGLGVSRIEPLSGPQTVGAGSGTSIGSFTQTRSAAFGMWMWAYSFGEMQGTQFRRYRGWIAALAGGANATRVSMFDGDRISAKEAGLATTFEPVMPWAEGQGWDGGMPWATSYPLVPVSAAAAFDTTIVQLGSAFWGQRLDIGDFIGFVPFHLGMYEITEAMGAGRYRVWPALRKAVTVSDYATLDPVMAMRLESKDAATAARGLDASEGASATLVEVMDYDVRDYFKD